MDIFIIKGDFNNRCSNITTCIILSNQGEIFKAGKSAGTFWENCILGTRPLKYSATVLKKFQ